MSTSNRAGLRLRPALAAATVAGLALAAVAAPSSAGARQAPRVVPLVSGGFVGPLGLAAPPEAGTTTFYVADAFANTLYSIHGGADPNPIAGGGSIAGVATGNDHQIWYTLSKQSDGGAPSVRDLQVRRISEDGTNDLIALPLKHERAHNPDSVNTYGFAGLSESCESKVPRYARTHHGGVESNPYKLAAGPGNSMYLADAAANAILQVRRNGSMRTVAVLPPVRVLVTKRLAKRNGMPACTVGEHYRSEPVPTDVEVGPRGRLYVSSLPGAPEKVRSGGVYRVNPETGRVALVRRGFTSAVDLAIYKHRIFVAELFAGQVVSTTLRGGPIVKVTRKGRINPAAVETWDRPKSQGGPQVFATTMVFDEQGNPTNQGAIVAVTHPPRD